MFEKLETLMFDNVGKKLKNIIKWIMRVEIILLVIFAIIMEFGALIQLFNGASENFLFMLLIPIGLVLAIGVLWFSVVVMYGFAEMVDTAIINRKEEEKPSYQPVADTAAPAPVPTPKSQKRCVQCGMLLGERETFCANCGTDYTPKQVVMENYWECTCGKVNPRYVSTCSCGKNAREVREQNREEKE